MVNVETLLAFSEFFPLGDVALIDIANHAEITCLKKGKRLIASETQANRLYLISGKLELQAQGIATQIIEENKKRAQTTIFRVHTPGLYAQCTRSCEILKISNETLKKYVLASPVTAGIYVDTVKIDTLNNPGNNLIEEVNQRFISNSFNLPSLPEIAIHVNTAIDDDTIGINKLTSIVQSDPAICARIIQVSNSALYAAGQTVNSLQKAITRIGLQAVRSIVIGVVMRDLFRPETRLIKKTMQRYYEHSIRIAVISHVLAKRCEGFDPDHAFLAGLLHDIGVIPLLVVADKHAELSHKAGTLDEVLTDLKGTVGSLLLRQWDFDESYALLSEQVYNWDRESNASPDYCDLVQVSLLHSALVGGEKIIGPSLINLPAFNRLGLGNINPDDDIKTLKEMSMRISEMINSLCA